MIISSFFRPLRYKPTTKSAGDNSNQKTTSPNENLSTPNTPNSPTVQNAPKIKRRNNNISSSTSSMQVESTINRLQQALATTTSDDDTTNNSNFVVNIKCSSSGQIEVDKIANNSNNRNRSKLSSGGMLNSTMSSNGSKDSLPWENDINAIAKEYKVKYKTKNSDKSVSEETNYSSPSVTLLPVSTSKMSNRHPSSASGASSSLSNFRTPSQAGFSSDSDKNHQQLHSVSEKLYFKK